MKHTENEKADIAFVNRILVDKDIPDYVIQDILEYIFLHW